MHTAPGLLAIGILTHLVTDAGC